MSPQPEGWSLSALEMARAATNGRVQGGTKAEVGSEAAGRADRDRDRELVAKRSVGAGA